jgi:hypothetical protein
VAGQPPSTMFSQKATMFSVKVIAQYAGISAGMIYQLFESKE